MVHSSRNSARPTAHRSQTQWNDIQSPIEMDDLKSREADILRRNRSLEETGASTGGEALPPYIALEGDAFATPARPEAARMTRGAASAINPTGTDAPAPGRDVEAQGTRRSRNFSYYHKMEVWVLIFILVVAFVVIIPYSVKRHNDGTSVEAGDIFVGLFGLSIPVLVVTQFFHLYRAGEIEHERSRAQSTDVTYERAAEKARQMRLDGLSLNLIVLLLCNFVITTFYCFGVLNFILARDNRWKQQVVAAMNGTIVLGPHGDLRVAEGREFDMSIPFPW